MGRANSMEKSVYYRFNKISFDKFRAFSYSLIGHSLLLAVIFTLRPHLTTLPKQLVEVIQARLYQLPTQEKVIKESDNNTPSLAQPNTVTTKTNETIKPEPTADTINQKTNQSDQSQKTNTMTQKKEKLAKPITSTSVKADDAHQALQSLKSKITQQSYEQSAQQHYQDFIAAKNAIPRSITKVDEIPEAKAVAVNVNCNSTFNKGITILSGLLGGSVKCASYHGSQ